VRVIKKKKKKKKKKSTGACLLGDREGLAARSDAGLLYQEFL